MSGRNANWSWRPLLAAGGAAVAVAALGGCAMPSGGDAVSPAVTVTVTRGPSVPAVQGSAACRQIQMMNLPSVGNAIDSANDFGAQPPNGATRLTRSQMAAMRTDGKVLLALPAPGPEFGRNAQGAGQLLETIGNSLTGYVDNNQAPAMDRYERYLQGACGLQS